MTSPVVKSQPRLIWPVLICTLAGAAVFQFYGNSTRGYIHTSSLFWWWGSQWMIPSSETRHGWIILGLSGWLFWRNLQIGNRAPGVSGLESHEPKDISGSFYPVWLPLAAMLGGLGLHAVGYGVQQTRVSIAALLLFIWGLLALAGGRRWGRAAAFPLGFMLFAVPVDFLDTVGFYLRLWVIGAGAALAHAAGIGVIHNGTQLISPDGRYGYDVAAACSGVRSLMAMLALSLLTGYLNLRAWWLRGAVLVLSLPAVFIGNVVRIAAIIFVAQGFGQAAGARVHESFGFLIFFIVLGLVMATVAMLRRFDKKAATLQPVIARMPDPVTPQSAVWRVAAIVVLAAAGVVLIARQMDALPPAESVGLRLLADGVNPAGLPVFLGTEWMGANVDVTPVERDILPPDTGFSRKLYARLGDARQSVLVSIVLSGRDRSSIHRPELCLQGLGWTVLGSEEHEFVAGGRAWPATVLYLERQGTARRPVTALVAYWFVGGKSSAATTAGRMLREAWDRLFHWRRNRWAYVLVQTGAGDGGEAALARMQEVTAQALLPVLPAQQ